MKKNLLRKIISACYIVICLCSCTKENIISHTVEYKVLNADNKILMLGYAEPFEGHINMAAGDLSGQTPAQWSKTIVFTDNIPFKASMEVYISNYDSTSQMFTLVISVDGQVKRIEDKVAPARSVGPFDIWFTIEK